HGAISTFPRRVHKRIDAKLKNANARSRSLICGRRLRSPPCECCVAAASNARIRNRLHAQAERCRVFFLASINLLCQTYSHSQGEPRSKKAAKRGKDKL